MGSETILLFFWAPQKQSGPDLARRARPSTDIPEFRCSDGLDLSGPKEPPTGTIFLYRKEEILSWAVSLYLDPAPASLVLGLPAGLQHRPSCTWAKGGRGPVVRVRWGGWTQEREPWVPACLPLVLGSPGLPEPLVLHLEKGSVSQGRGISVANAHQHQPM